jgi:prenyltransferase beta subunit
MAEYLAEQDIDDMDLIHYAAYMRCRMIQRLLEGGKLNVLIHSFFSSPVKQLLDFPGLPHDDPEAPYTQFVWLSLLEDTGQTVKNKHDVLDALALYRIPSGGYSNMQNGVTAATNATAAGLIVTGQLDGYRKNADVDYLWGTQKESGGFGATERSPLPDMLSTATSLFTLDSYGIQPKYSPVDFIEAHWQNTGGFSATLLEDTSDVEYTFYGLLALGAI